jgi:polar amino acid transport system substrate-binding protein
MQGLQSKSTHWQSELVRAHQWFTRGLSAAFVVLLSGAAVRGDALDRVQNSGVLPWGGDQEGGGPYIYPSPDDSKRLLGFEVELMDLVAAKLGVRAEFHQCEWVNLPDLLRTGGIDVIANGYELTSAHLQTKQASIPYYIYELQLLVRRDNDRLKSWNGLTGRGKPFRVGVLGGSAAETFVRQHYADTCTVRLYTGVVDAMLDVQNGGIDATVQDLPAAIFYQNRFPKLHAVGEPAGRGYYVLYFRPDDKRLKERLDEALLSLIRDGSLKTVYERYGIWNSTQEQLGTLHPEVELAGGSSTATRGWQVVRRNLPILLQSAGLSVLLTFASMPLAIVLGLVVALGRLYAPRPVQWVLAGYVEVLRGTPLLLQLYSIYYALPSAIGISLNPLAAAIFGLALNYSAYESEIYRAGLLAIPVGQMEAALALGMSRFQALRYIVIPQAVRLVIPPVANDFIGLFKDTSICSTITLVELTKRYQILVTNTNAYLELMAVTALLYLAMSYPLAVLARNLESRHRQARA